jgi:hypothetical protein
VDFHARNAARVVGAAVAAGAVGAAVACSGGVGHDASDAAADVCGRAFPGATVAAAYVTTVGDIRGRAIGPGLHPARGAWPSRADGEQAVWCYLDLGDGDTRAAGAADGEVPVVFAEGNFTPSPIGPQVP